MIVLAVNRFSFRAASPGINILLGQGLLRLSGGIAVFEGVAEEEGRGEECWSKTTLETLQFDVLLKAPG